MYALPIVQPPFMLDFYTMFKRELANYREWFLDILPVRMRTLEEAVRYTGVERWRANETPDSLNTQGEWLATQVEARELTAEESAQTPLPSPPAGTSAGPQPMPQLGSS